MQVGRNALPPFNAGLESTPRKTLYLHCSQMNNVTNFGGDVLGIYQALGVPAAAVAAACKGLVAPTCIPLK